MDNGFGGSSSPQIAWQKSAHWGLRNDLQDLSISALELLNEIDIILVCLPPNTAHITQPLDKAKQTQVARIRQTDEQYFSYLLKKLWEAVTPRIERNLKAGFESCGIVPVAQGKILRFMNNPEFDNKSSQASFTEALEKIRLEWTVLPKPRNRKRINVAAGKGVDGDVLATEDDGTSTSSGEHSANKSKQKKFLTLGEEEENEEFSAITNDSSEDVELWGKWLHD
ncbi:hypothetical protein PR048_023940 [Dryococelus australis]|uniref:DDE-1 domain-containing protein n=1 Tax=Dryococelus australis TaxID=614101 RepID=A0ABQ9GVI3_9NEOP|nr:hypothetical protein PR048_023940 [Dryococelus australis]